MEEAYNAMQKAIFLLNEVEIKGEKNIEAMRRVIAILKGFLDLFERMKGEGRINDSLDE